jgi:hypothetical protein
MTTEKTIKIVNDEQPLLGQVFYNSLIQPLTAILTGLESNAEKTEILLSLSVIQQRLAVDDWSPFPGYQLLCEKLNLRKKIEDIYVKTLVIYDPSTLEKTIAEQSKQEISDLITFSHFLNFLDSIANPNKAKNEILRSFSHTPGSEQLVEVTTNQGQNIPLSFFRTPPPENPGLKRVMEIIKIMSDKELENFCKNSFCDTKNGSEISSETCETLKSKCKNNLFLLGHAEFFIGAMNVYKQEFATNISNETARINEASMAPNMTLSM